MTVRRREYFRAHSQVRRGTGHSSGNNPGSCIVFFPLHAYASCLAIRFTECLKDLIRVISYLAIKLTTWFILQAKRERSTKTLFNSRLVSYCAADGTQDEKKISNLATWDISHQKSTIVPFINRPLRFAFKYILFNLQSRRNWLLTDSVHYYTGAHTDSWTFAHVLVSYRVIHATAVCWDDGINRADNTRLLSYTQYHLPSTGHAVIAYYTI